MKKNHFIIGLDVGGTKISSGLVNYQGRVIKFTKTKTEIAKGKDHIIKNILAAIAGLFSSQVDAIGIGICGSVDFKNGIVRSCASLSKDWQNVNLKKIVAEKFKRPVSIDNDAKCITLAEAIYGPGKKYSYVVSLTLGTGIGSGFVINKKIYRGQDNAAEFSHTFISEKGPLCACGQRGHFESLASGSAMVKLYQELTDQKKDTFQIEKEALQGKKEAKKVIKLMTNYLGTGLANIVNALNPEIIVIGGGLARVKILFKPALLSMRKKIHFASPKQNTKIILSKLGDHAGVLGAALITNKLK